MTIKLITQEDFNILSDIQKKHPLLTYQNTGYDGFDKSKMTPEDKEAFSTIETILKKSIRGFSSFQNFKLSIKNELKLRFQYDYSYDGGGNYFIGVGYILLDELLNGFKEIINL